ncbi:type VI secretion system tip protein TssI/VgrG [Sorangium sp. So ce321]|uniref:type VI secretion system Vgr family protein n=1 Tax=Sorangium sp. So ce321 TaxID=3133300 RepID=UPI003F63C0D4
MAVAVRLAEGLPAVECRAFSGEERLGEPSRFDVVVASPEPIAAAAALGSCCSVTLDTQHGARALLGVVTQWTAVATSRQGAQREYRFALGARLALLEHRRRSRIFQRLSVPAIVQKVLGEGGYGASAVVLALSEEHAPRDHVVQYDETDAAFVRRMCEEEGLYFRFPCQAGDADETIEITDRSPGAPPALPEPLPLVDEASLLGPGPALTRYRALRRRRPGKVTLRGYDPERPAVLLEATHSDGTDLEQRSEVYEVAARPGEARDPARARLRLESLRAEALRCSFQSTALALAPGLLFSVEVSASHVGAPPPGREHLVVAVKHGWSASMDVHRVEVESIPREVPFRLAQRTARPRIHGAQSAIVTGPPGAEIHPDDLGRVCVRFHWDLEGPGDAASSLPIRTLQPNTPGSMLVPRVGWEVFALFEDGDPARPYVIGRSYNAKSAPPFPLPANKTMTVLATDSSPGAGGRNLLSFDDAAGREHLAVQATFGKTTTARASMVVQTVHDERYSVAGSQSREVAADEAISVKQAYFDAVGSQSGSVGGQHKVTAAGDLGVVVGSESVLVGGALVEQVGDPVKGALQLAAAAALHGVGSKGTAGRIAASALGIAKAAAEGAMQRDGGGWEGAAQAGKMAAAGALLGLLPGGDAIMASVAGAKAPPPWDPDAPDPGAAQGGGGAGGGSSDASAPAGPGPGHRNVVVSGNALVGIGGSSLIASAGTIGWKTLGASAHATGGSRTIKAAAVTQTAAGASVESIGGGAHIVASGGIGRGAAAAASLEVSGALVAEGASYAIEAPKIAIRVGGALSMSGAHVTFSVPGATLAASPAGLLIKASTIEIEGLVTQSGSLSHR